MAKDKKAKPRIDPGEETNPPLTTEDRNEELSKRSEIHEALLEIYKDVESGFESQYDRSNLQMDMWDIYNCRLSPKQYYSGTTKIFVPIVHDAVKARVTRFNNQIFPTNGRYVEVTTMDGEIPHGEMNLVHHYVDQCKLRTEIVPALLRNGDVEGQYNVYVDWKETTRHIAYKKQRPELAGPKDNDDALPEDMVEEVVTTGRPEVEVIADSDILVLPHTAKSCDDALDQGGSVTILRRWSKSKIKQLIKDELILKEEGDALLKEMQGDRMAVAINKQKQMVDAAGIKPQGQMSKFALIYETWTLLTIGNERRICRVYYGGDKVILSCKRNPNWNDKLPIFSCSLDKVQGAFKGKSLLEPCEQIQYLANDAINEGADSGMFAMMPIVMTDPEKNPRIGSMVLSLAAVWECDPNSTKFAEFPDMWGKAFETVTACKNQIMQTLSVSPAAITQSNQTKSKPSQADVAREQQVDILTTAEAVIILEEGILTPVVNFMVELDHQYRHEKMLIRQFGETGVRAKMDWVDPVQMDKKLSYRWFGVEQARTAMQLQQQIAFSNVLFQIPPDKYPGHRLNMVPLLTHAVENIFGPRLAPLIFQDEKEQLTIPAELENQWMLEWHVDLTIHPMDEDAQHLQEHSKALQQGDPQGLIRAHMARHQFQLNMKQQAQLAQQIAMMHGQPGGGGGGKPPRSGSQPKKPRHQGPAGAPGRDQLAARSGNMPFARPGNGAM